MLLQTFGCTGDVIRLDRCDKIFGGGHGTFLHGTTRFYKVRRGSAGFDGVQGSTRFYGVRRGSGFYEVLRGSTGSGFYGVLRGSTRFRVLQVLRRSSLLRLKDDPLRVGSGGFPPRSLQVLRGWRVWREKGTSDRILREHRGVVAGLLVVEMLLEKGEWIRILPVVDENRDLRSEPDQIPAVVKPVVETAGTRADAVENRLRHGFPVQAWSSSDPRGCHRSRACD